MYLNCAFTGHRDLREDFDESLLLRVIEDLIKTGTEKFLCGMARGFDLKAAECVLELKKIYDVKLCACIPCGDQDKYFSRETAERYNKILQNCDEKVILGEYYFNGCMQMRDRYMVENCDVLVCYLREPSGGTYYTVSYAQSKNKKVIKL